MIWFIPLATDKALSGPSQGPAALAKIFNQPKNSFIASNHQNSAREPEWYYIFYQNQIIISASTFFHCYICQEPRLCKLDLVNERNCFTPLEDNNDDMDCHWVMILMMGGLWFMPTVIIVLEHPVVRCVVCETPCADTCSLWYADDDPQQQSGNKFVSLPPPPPFILLTSSTLLT